MSCIGHGVRPARLMDIPINPFISLQDQMKCGCCEAYKPGVDQAAAKKKEAEEKQNMIAKLMGGGSAPGTSSLSLRVFRCQRPGYILLRSDANFCFLLLHGRGVSGHLFR